MDRMHGWVSRRRRCGPTGESGFAMIELLMAIVIFAILAAAVLSTLALAQRTTRTNRNRVAAASLAARELEIVRNQFTSVQGPTSVDTNLVTNPDQLSGGTIGAPLVVDNVPYTLTRTAQWTASGSAAATSTCDQADASALTALKVHVEVTWPHMGTITPVTSDGLLTPSKGAFSSANGHVAVKVLDRNGAGESGRDVTVTGGPSGTVTGVTGSDGCAVFGFLQPGSYSASVQDVGYVGPKNDQVPTQNVTVIAGQLSRYSFQYDRAATLTATISPTRAGYFAPTGTGSGDDVEVTLTSTDLALGSDVRSGAGDVRILTDLWPGRNGYTLWAGACSDADPNVSGGSRANPVGVSPGSVGVATVELAPLWLRMIRTDGTTPAGMTVVATHAVGTGCSAGDTVTLGTSDATGTLKTSLPYGQWSITVAGRTPGLGVWPTVTLRRGAAAPSAPTWVVWQ